MKEDLSKEKKQGLIHTSVKPDILEEPLSFNIRLPGLFPGAEEVAQVRNLPDFFQVQQNLCKFFRPLLS